MSQETDRSGKREKRKELPIERGFPIERVNEIAEKEGRGVAKQYYRPIYTMHKWWARRLGCVFRSICLYTLLDDPDKVHIQEPGENGSLRDYSGGHSELEDLIDQVQLDNPDSLWGLYNKDVQISDKKILDPFMGGGTSLVEASRFSVEADGGDINPVAWFVVKKQLEAGQTDVSDLEKAFEQVKDEVKNEITQYFKTPCPNGDHDADVLYNFWVKEVGCPSCGKDVPLFDDYRIAKGRYDQDDKNVVFCPDCDHVTHVDDWRSDSSCDHCGNKFNPQQGNSSGSSYNCPNCGQKYEITDAIKEQGGYDLRLYAVEYYCPTCKEQGLDKNHRKGYKRAEAADLELVEQAQKEWREKEDLREYVPSEAIPEGHMTSERNPVFDHGYEDWTDMFSERQLLCLAKLLRAIDNVEDQKLKEFLLMAATDSLRGISMMITYQLSSNAISSLFKTNSFDPPKRPAENNVWGADKGARTFARAYQRTKKGIEWASAPIERYKNENGSMEKSSPFSTPVGQNTSVSQRDVREITSENEYDAVITDPPYYDNIIYSELSDYFYTWQRVLLKEEYTCFEPSETPKQESIVANPAHGKGAKEFEAELRDSFGKIRGALKPEGALVFTYHHSDSESWGELLQALCDVGFEITASYPVTADLDKITKGTAVSFDIIVVARPAKERTPISWNSLRRNIHRTAQRTHQRLEQDRDLSAGDIGVIEMGRCFHEYSKHHGKVQRAGEIMSAKEVVDEIYGIIQEGSEIGEIDVFLDLLETTDPSYDDLNKLTRGTNASLERMKDMRLYNMDDGFELGTWNNPQRIAYIQERMNGVSDDNLNSLDKSQFLRYCYEEGKSIQNYLDQWGVDDELRELCEGLADATGDDTYRRILGGSASLRDY